MMIGIDEKWLHERGFTKQPDGSWKKPRRAVFAVHSAPRAEPERAVSHAHPVEAQREAIYPGRVLIRITSFCCGIQRDDDNICPKFFIDCCRYAGLIHSDAPGTVKLRIEEKRVSTKKEEGCLIEITPF